MLVVNTTKRVSSCSSGGPGAKKKKAHMASDRATMINKVTRECFMVFILTSMRFLLFKREELFRPNSMKSGTYLKIDLNRDTRSSPA